ncbi:contact-dependent growth inhibition system immunity protein [Nocardia rhamnosiphila]|uniref:contact-dependent growth inhibition system immunity protein n=1 Tax=Nocardia rhamnosiphila TaxID=426716 RepID=UPI0009DEC1B6|nr:contact-dependent growth inhibition system immunity protein [Nocardia rhamnosiphila]
MTYRDPRSLSQIEGRAWPAPDGNATRLMKTVHALREVPLPDLTVEDIRVLLSQREGVDVLTPVALDILGSNPLAEGDFYPGDLLTALLGCHARESDPAGLVSRIEQLIERISEKGDLEQYDAPHNTIWSSIDEWRTA